MGQARPARPRTLVVFALAIAFVFVVAPSAAAQEVPADLRLDPSTRDSLRVMLAEARAAGLPADPLIRKLREGAARGVGGARIVPVVRAYLVALGSARAALGARATAEELDAGAAALRAGASPISLQRVRELRDPGRATVALVVLTDLLSRGIAEERAASALGETLRSDRTDAAALEMRAEIARSTPSRDPALATESLERFLRRLEDTRSRRPDRPR
jgi:hypothetical protein